LAEENKRADTEADNSEKESERRFGDEELDDDIALPPESDPKFLLQKLDEAEISEELKSQLRAGITGIMFRARVTKETYSMQGMLPPSKLKEFDEILENGAERVFSEITKQTHHRQYLEKTTVDSDLLLYYF